MRLRRYVRGTCFSVRSYFSSWTEESDMLARWARAGRAALTVGTLGFIARSLGALWVDKL